MKISLLLFAVFVAGVSNTFANESCKAPAGFVEKDMRDEFGPTRDQGDIGWCYAYGGADMIGHYMHKKMGVETRTKDSMISASALSIDYNLDQRNLDLGKLFSQKRIYAANLENLKNAEERVKASSSHYSKLENDLLERDSKAKEAANQLSDATARLRHKTSQMGGMGNYYNHIGYAQYGSGYGQLANGSNGYGNFAIDPDVTLMMEKNKEIAELSRAHPDVTKAQRKMARDQSEVYQIKALAPKTQTEREGGWPEQFMTSNLKKGFCLEKDVPSDGFDTSKNDGLSAFINNGINPYLLNPTDKSLCAAADSAQKMFPQLPLEDIKEVLKKSLENEEDATQALMEKSCKRTSTMSPTPTVKKVTGTPDEMIKQFREALAKGQPVGVAYQSEVLRYGGDLYSKEVKSNSGHFSVLIGQRMNCQLGEPEYILRNSWGADACTAAENMYQSLPHNDKKLEKINEEMGDCLAAVNVKKPEHDELGISYKECHQNAFGKYKAAQNIPFTCDSKGNFIIRESQLKRGLRQEGVILE